MQNTKNSVSIQKQIAIKNLRNFAMDVFIYFPCQLSQCSPILLRIKEESTFCGLNWISYITVVQKKKLSTNLHAFWNNFLPLLPGKGSFQKRKKKSISDKMKSKFICNAYT